MDYLTRNMKLFLCAFLVILGVFSLYNINESFTISTSTAIPISADCANTNDITTCKMSLKQIDNPSSFSGNCWCQNLQTYLLDVYDSYPTKRIKNFSDFLYLTTNSITPLTTVQNMGSICVSNAILYNATNAEAIYLAICLMYYKSSSLVGYAAIKTEGMRLANLALTGTTASSAVINVIPGEFKSGVPVGFADLFGTTTFSVTNTYRTLCQGNLTDPNITVSGNKRDFIAACIYSMILANIGIGIITHITRGTILYNDMTYCTYQCMLPSWVPPAADVNLIDAYSNGYNHINFVAGVSVFNDIAYNCLVNLINNVSTNITNIVNTIITNNTVGVKGLKSNFTTDDIRIGINIRDTLAKYAQPTSISSYSLSPNLIAGFVCNDVVIPAN